VRAGGGTGWRASSPPGTVVAFVTSDLLREVACRWCLPLILPGKPPPCRLAASTPTADG
jgi:hypothetical protein